MRIPSQGVEQHQTRTFRTVTVAHSGLGNGKASGTSETSESFKNVATRTQAAIFLGCRPQAALEEVLKSVA